MTLRVRYQTIEFHGHDIHVRTLRDKQQFSDPFGEAETLGVSSAQWSLFGVIWPSGEILAREVEHYEIEGKRILEVGCGIALSSLLLNARNADITATDYHPEAAKFLTENVHLNNARPIPFLRTGWEDENDRLGLFDLVIGSDLLYERQHFDHLSEFINRHARPTCEVLLVDPGRGNHGRFSKKMGEFGFRHSQRKPESLPEGQEDFKGHIHRYRREVTPSCVKGAIPA